VPIGRTPHTPDAELVAARRWLDPAAVFADLPADRWYPTYERAALLLSSPPGPTVLVHRDLHDKQLVVAPDGAIGMLDLDLATAGEAALDLANLLVHLRWRTLQGVCSRARSELCREALLDGYAPDPRVRDRLTAYAAATWLRLAGVYALRAAPAELVASLLDEAAAAVQRVPQPAG
jgi:aminoglycoside phosphotransferase (APT) family kinase protein